MKYTFDRQRLDTLLGCAKRGNKKILLVGDNGVYLCVSGIYSPDDPKKLLCAYANECNPETMEFDAWWEAKNAGWGGDDGVEELDPDILEGLISINFTEESVEIEYEVKP